MDLFADSLAARGVIEHQFQPRRATIYGDRILSVSGQELLSVKFSNRDQPVVRGATELAWPVDRVVLAGDYLIEAANGSRSWGWWNWGNQDEALLRVTLASDPEHVLSSLSLSNLAISGVSKQGNYLYVAQAPAIWFFPPYPLAASSGDQMDTNANDTPLIISVIDLSDLPQLSVVGRVETKSDGMFFGGELQPLWPKAGMLVWVGGAADWWWWRLGPMGGPVGSAARPIAWPWFWPSGSSTMFAFDVSDPATPAFASKVDLAASNRWSFSTAFTAQELIYVSHQTSEFVPGLDTPWKTPARTNVVVDATTGESNVVITPSGSWVQRSFLDVVDYADAAHPTIREPVNISGGLQGISHQGALLYTSRSESHSKTDTNGYVSWTWTQRLDALAYDGVSAHLVDSLELPNAWPQPVRVVGNNIFLGRPGYDYYSTNRYPHYLETWTIANTGNFAQLGRTVLTDPASALQDFPGMLVAQQNANNLVLFDLADPANLKVIGRGAPLGCLWFDLNHADGNATQGLWLPLGGFGVGTVARSR